jgi:hypothetical protein
MSIVGVVCPYDDSYQTFDHCIHCHENRSPTRNCAAPVFALKSMRDNHITRSDAGISASTLISCPRAIAMAEVYDLYETVISGYNKGYNKARGSWLHAMVEADIDPPPWIIRERRLYLDVLGRRISGKPDEVDPKYKVLVDYKSKDNVPKMRDMGHEFQFNVYVYLLAHGYWADTNEKADIIIETIGAHYLTWKTKAELAWKKVGYPVWNDTKTRTIIEQRLKPLIQWQETGLLPSCNPYVPARYWKCDCVKYAEQLADRGIELKEQHNR